jgi:hypothetical protein
MINVSFDRIKDEPNIVFVNPEGDVITQQQLEDKLKQGYRTGVVMFEQSENVFVPVLMYSTYHKEHARLEISFISETFKVYCQKEDIPVPNIYEVGEVLYVEAN